MASQNLDLSMDTKLGKVVILKTGSCIPSGYRWVFPDECQWMKIELWELVRQKLGSSKVALATGYFDIVGYMPSISYDGDNSDSKFYLAISPDVTSYRIDNFTTTTELIKNNKYLLLSHGLIVKVGIKQQIPENFRKLTLQQGKKYQERLHQILEYWSYVSFETGRMNGEGERYKIEESSTKQCKQIFITSIASF